MSKKAETVEVSDAVWLAEELAEGLFPETAPEKCDGAVTTELMASRQIQSWRKEGEAACMPILLRALDVYATAFGYNDVGEVLTWLAVTVGHLGGDSGGPLDPFVMPPPNVDGQLSLDDFRLLLLGKTLHPETLARLRAFVNDPKHG